jgi:serine/threonine protein phosphatase PrpC
MSYLIEISKHSLNKKNEELCGDCIEIYKEDGDAIIILADGLGSGVKANILATLTTKIAMTMLKKNQSIEETIETIMSTLPICKVRGIAYSTFSIIKIDKYFNCTIIEYDNPPVIVIENDELREIVKTRHIYNQKEVKISDFKINEGTYITLVSDGVVHAGIGLELNHGWQWHHIADYLKRQKKESVEIYNRELIQGCNTLYDGKPGDDASAVTFTLTKKKVINVMIGPPKDKKLDKKVVKEFNKRQGQKIICGGTTSQITARVLEKEIITTFDYINEKLPPIARIDGFELVTEGLLTLKETLNRLKRFNENNQEKIDSESLDGATLLLKKLVNEGNTIHFFIGRAINKAFHNQQIPFELSTKYNIIKKIIKELEKLDKEIKMELY